MDKLRGSGGVGESSSSTPYSLTPTPPHSLTPLTNPPPGTSPYWGGGHRQAQP